MKKLFKYYMSPSNIKTEEVEFADDATEEEIHEAFNEWAWEQIGDLVWMEDVE